MQRWIYGQFTVKSAIWVWVRSPVCPQLNYASMYCGFLLRHSKRSGNYSLEILQMKYPFKGLLALGKISFFRKSFYTPWNFTSTLSIFCFPFPPPTVMVLPWWFTCLSSSSVLIQSMRVWRRTSIQDHLCEDQPDIDHLHVGRLWEAAWNADEQGGQDEQGGEIDSDDSLIWIVR